jgi:site-specific DNA-adenine methylase
MSEKIRTLPLSYFGKKTRIAPFVWDLFDAANTGMYIEPFAGSGAVLFARPIIKGHEVINDKEIRLLNLYRSIKYKPDELVESLHNCKSAVDLAAYTLYMNEHPLELDDFINDPTFCLPHMAGYFCLRVSASLGHMNKRQNPDGVMNISDKACYAVPMWKKREALTEWIYALRKRLDKVEILCTDWTKPVSDAHLSVSYGSGKQHTSVFLDPPYEGFETLYKHRVSVSSQVRQWCIDKSDFEQLRIVVCGYNNEHDELLDYGFIKHVSKSVGGNLKENNDNDEYIWASKSCTKPVLTLF